MSLKNELVAVGNALMTSDEIIQNIRGTVIRVTKVFMDPEIYPHFKKNKIESNI